MIGYENGALPTKEYIQGWFSRRKAKMAEEERKKLNKDWNATNNLDDHEDIEVEVDNSELLSMEANVYSHMSTPGLTDLVLEQIQSKDVTVKALYSKLLQYDDILCGHEAPVSDYRSGHSVGKLIKYCEERQILVPAPKTLTKSLLIAFLESHDKVRVLQSSMKQIDPIVLRHELEIASD